MVSITDDLKLFQVFYKYCQFGVRESSPHSTSPHSASPHSASPHSTSPHSASPISADSPKNLYTKNLMDGSKFAKLAREAGLIDGHVITTMEIDIIFSRVREKSERKISFVQFKRALEMIGSKRFGPEKATDVLTLVSSLQGPSLAPGTTVPVHSDKLERLMEASASYISRRQPDDSKAWKDDLRSSPGKKTNLSLDSDLQRP